MWCVFSVFRTNHVLTTWPPLTSVARGPCICSGALPNHISSRFIYCQVIPKDTRNECFPRSQRNNPHCLCTTSGGKGNLKKISASIKGSTVRGLSLAVSTLTRVFLGRKVWNVGIMLTMRTHQCIQGHNRLIDYCGYIFDFLWKIYFCLPGDDSK